MIEQFSPDSKLWIYPCNRALQQEELALIANELELFCRSWTAHNQSLKAGFKIDYNRFIILAVDESLNNASGCSIDKSVHFLKELSLKFNLDLFSRLDLIYLKGSELKTLHYTHIKTAFQKGELSIDTLFFNTQIETLGQLDSDFLVPLKQHWLNKQLQLSV